VRRWNAHNNAVGLAQLCVLISNLHFGTVRPLRWIGARLKAKYGKSTLDNIKKQVSGVLDVDGISRRMSLRNKFLITSFC
jgi:hypothetical protein